MIKRLCFAALAVAACSQTNNVTLTFGDMGEGLDGFLCVDDGGVPVLDDRLGHDAGVASASMVIDFLDLGGVPSCRVSELVAWCATHDCHIVPGARVCLAIELPTGIDGLTRAQQRTKVQTALASLKGDQVTPNAPSDFVMVRAIATSQPCDALTGVDLPEFDPARLLGCAYSCPVLFNSVDDAVYLGFDTLTADCEQGLRICSGKDLHWEP
jgi:hypothetical protein